MKFECIFAVSSPKTLTYKSNLSGHFLCSDISDISQIYWLSYSYGAPVDSFLGVGLWRDGRRQPFFYTYSNIFPSMPKTGNICARANNSTPVATLFHETENLVSIHNGQVVTTSLQVAEVFQRPHKDVLSSIRRLECSRDLQERNFSPSFYTVDLPNGGHKQQPMYYIGRDGFVFLVMGFTGKIAARFKEAYIRQFNEMEEMLRKSEETRKVVSEMEKTSTIWRLYRNMWPLSEFMAYFWTTNREIAFGYRILAELSGKRMTSDEQIEIMKTIKMDL